MKENDITHLFRQQLTDAEMPVKDGFWEELTQDLVSLQGPIQQPRKSFQLRTYYRVISAASVLLLLGIASVVLWNFSPRREIQEAFTRIESMSPIVTPPMPKTVHPDMPSMSPAPIQHIAHNTAIPNGIVPPPSATSNEKMPLSIHMSITITQHGYDQSSHPRHGYASLSEEVILHSDKNNATGASKETDNTNAVSLPQSVVHSSPWSMKIFAGSTLPRNAYHAPLTVGIGVERSLTKRFFVETGLRYHFLPTSNAHDTHALSIPLKFGYRFIDTPRLGLYANVGGSVEKTIAGAPDNSFKAQPVQLAVEAGLGISYKLNERFALLAEPMVTHHFHTNASTRTLRHARPTNLALLCGVRMTY